MLLASQLEKEICETKKTGIIKLKSIREHREIGDTKSLLNHPMDTGLVTNSKTGKIIPEYFINKKFFKK